MSQQAQAFVGAFSAGSGPLEVALRPGDLSVVFQPIIDLRPRSRLLHGVECLARGPLGTPLEGALALFEYVRSRGAEIGVDRACIAGALRAAATLAAAPRFSLNVHARTLSTDSGFPDFLLEELGGLGLSPLRLTLDVLAPHHLSAGLFDCLAELRAVGASIAFDDIGVANSDCRGLLECGPDYLKLDRAFMRRDPPDDARDLMLDSVVRLARSAGALAVMEGVETLEELDAAVSHGIHLVQGKFFGEPMSLDSLGRTGLLAPDLELAIA